MVENFQVIHCIKSWGRFPSDRCKFLQPLCTAVGDTLTLWKVKRKKLNSLSFSSHVLFREELEWNFSAFLSEVGLCASTASTSPCDTSPQCDDYCGSVTVCQEFGRNLKLLLFYLFEDANAPKNKCKRNPDLSLFFPKGYAEIQLTVQELWLASVVSLPPFS